MDCLRSMLTCEPTTIAFRSTGSVPVPVRKGSSASSSWGAARGVKRSVLPATLTGPEHNYGVQVSRTHIEGRAVTRDPDVTKEVRRGNMKERWGMEVVYRATDSVSLELAVTKVCLPSAAHSAGLRAGNVITIVNDWNVEAMQVPEAVQTVLMAGGFFMKLGWLNETLSEFDDTWKYLGKF